MTKPHIHLNAMGFFEAVSDVVLFCQKGLELAGHSTSFAIGSVLPHEINLVFCSQHVNWTYMSAGAKRLIVYNLEPTAADIGRFPATYIRQMQSTHVWDYSQKNVLTLKKAGVQDIHHVPLGYVSEMQRIEQAVTQDIDVLFYGGASPRRQRVIDAIRLLGLHVVTSDDVGHMSADVRDGYIARSKVVLNIHFFEQTQSHVLEMARVGYLLANRKAVVAEVSEHTDVEDDIRTAVASGTLDELPQLCWELVHDDVRRHELEQRAFDVFSCRDAGIIMGAAIDRYIEQASAAPPKIGNATEFCAPMPDVLNLKSGNSWRYDYCNLDFSANFAPDLPLKIDQPIDFDIPLESWRFGTVRLKPEMFKRIIAGDVFNKVTDLQQALTNCLLLLEVGCNMELTVPLDLSYEAWSHINDKRAFNHKTWENIINNWWQYGWGDYRFEIAHMGYNVSNEYGRQLLIDNNNDWDAAIKTPRAMDSMNITLHKRPLKDDERTQLPQVRFMD